MTSGSDLPAPPQGARSLIELIDAAERHGFAEQIDAVIAGDGEPRLRCTGCGVAADPSDVTVAWAARTEGASDPADELFVAAIVMPGCGARGVYVATYGPEADPADTAVLPRLPGPVRGDTAEPA